MHCVKFINVQCSQIPSYKLELINIMNKSYKDNLFIFYVKNGGILFVRKYLHMLRRTPMNFSFLSYVLDSLKLFIILFFSIQK